MITTSVTEAAECLSQGKVLAYPTEAVWGLGCDPYNEAAFRTWLLPADEQIPVWIRGQHPKVAVRVTNHPLCVALCNAFNSFIVSTSANPAGLEPARTLQEASQYFGSELNYLNGDLGLSQQPSRIIDAITGEIIRA